MPRPILALLLAATFGILAVLLRRRPILGPAAAFLAALFALKIWPAAVPPEGFLRDDFLFPLWALWERGSVWWRWFLPPVAAIGGLVVASRMGWLERAPAPLFLASVAAASCGVWLSLAFTAGGYPEGLVRPFERDAEYYADVARFASFGEIGAGYLDRQESLSLHGKTHPPGAVALLTVLDRAAGRNLPRVCLAVVALSVAMLPLVHAWGRAHLGEVGARRAALLWAATPAVLLYGATCMDMVFALPLAASFALYAVGMRRGTRPAAWGAGAGTLLGAGFLFTYSAAVSAAAFAAAAALGRSRRDAIRLAAAAGGTLGVLVVVRAATGFDAFRGILVAAAIDAREYPAFLSASYYGLTRLMGALDFLLLAGVAGAPALVAAVWRGVPEDPALGRFARATAIALALFLAAGAYKIGETGRIFLFVMPLVALLAARGGGDRVMTRGAWTILALHAAQAGLFEYFLDTRW